MNSGYFITILKSELRRRQLKNARYSQRSFARDLGIDAAILSKVFSKKYVPSLQLAEQMVLKLDVKQTTRRLFLESVIKSRTKMVTEKFPASEVTTTRVISQDTFRVISDWYHYAILELTFTESFKPDTKWIARTLGIDEIDAAVALRRLVAIGLLKKTDDSYRKTDTCLTTLDRAKTTEAQKTYTKAMLLKAAESVDKHTLDERFMFGMTMAIDPALFPVAQMMIEKFINELCVTLESGRQKRVYHMQSALYPLQELSI